MTMHIRALTIQDTGSLLNTINGAFADYIVPFRLNASQLALKMASENIRLEWSVGVFNGDMLVAFIMHGVRTVNGVVTVYNAGTGVLPDYRARGLVTKMYDYVLPFLKERQVKQLVLEVIESNLPAIRAYEKNGFSVNRKLLCFTGTIETKNKRGIATIKVLKDLPWAVFQSFGDILPAWQNDMPSMNVIQPQAFGAFMSDEMVGYVLFSAANKRLYQIAVLPQHRGNGIATQLLAEVGKVIPKETVQLNNVDEAAGNLKSFLEKQGFRNHINQFEMMRTL